MRNKPSASKKLFLFISLFLQFFTNIWLNVLGNVSKQSKPAKMLTSNASSSKFLSKDVLQFVGNFLEPDSAQKMKKTSKQWRNVKIYENIFPNEYKVAVFRNVNTEEIIWRSIQFKKLRFWETEIPFQKELVSLLHGNYFPNWNYVFLWLVDNRFALPENYQNPQNVLLLVENLYYLPENPQNVLFLKKLMLTIAENVAVKFTDGYEYSPLMLAAALDDNISILTLIKRGADVHQQNHYFKLTALHYAAIYGHINACAALLDNGANIDAATRIGYTPLMDAAYNGMKNVFTFLIAKGADKTLLNNAGETALQLARFHYDHK